MKIKSKPEDPILEGTVLLTSKPFAFVLKSKLRSERCNYCFKGAKVLRCSACQYVYYCSRECQKQAWIDHRDECSYLKKVSPRVVPDAAHLMARIILKLQRGGDQEKGYYSEKGFRKFKDLMSHYSDVKQDARRVEHFASLSAVLMDLLGESNLPNTAELMGIYGRMCVNGFNILDPEMLGIGTGIYLSASIIDHSCDPNAVAVFEGTTLYIRSIKKMPSLDWKKVRITYIELLNPTQTRRAELKNGYYFFCDCNRCESCDELVNAAQCSNAVCREPVTVDASCDEVQCSSCGHHIKTDVVQQFHEVMEFTQQQLEIMKDIAYLDVCQVCLKKQQGLLHPLNLLHVKILDLAFESSIDMGQWEQACELGEALKEGYRRHLGELHPLRGVFLLKLGKLQLGAGRADLAAAHLAEARRVLTATHGPAHSLLRHELLPLAERAHAALQA